MVITGMGIGMSREKKKVTFFEKIPIFFFYGMSYSERLHKNFNKIVGFTTKHIQY